MNIIFFDFNGTVLDDVDLCLDILNEMLELKKLRKVSKAEYLDIFDFPVKDYYKKAGLDVTEEEFKELSHFFQSQYILRYQKESHIYSDILQAIDYFKDLGYHIVLCSASNKKILEEQLHFFKIYDYFDEILGIDNIYAKGKTDIAINYVKDKTIEKGYFIGDTLHDAQVGKSIGCLPILIASGHQSYEKLTSNNNIVISNSHRLLEIIENI